MRFFDRLSHAWNAFNGRDSVRWHSGNYFGGMNSSRPDRLVIRPGTERSIVASIFNRIAIDVASVGIHHVRLDKNGRYKETINDGLNECLTHRANKDQSGRMLIQDTVLTLCDEGCAAIVPVDTSTDPRLSMSYEIESLRVGKIIQWAPDLIQVNLYNDRTGQREDIWLPKRMCAIIENPLYTIMNEPNSTLRRLIRKLNLLDAIDEQSASNKLDIIIQLPYSVKSELRRKEADERLKNIEMQLTGSKYGIAYIDATEHVTQLNRPVENNLLNQVDYLTNMVYSQLGMEESILNGTADEKTMLNYHNTTIEPMLSAIVDAMDIKFITKTAHTQGQAIKFFRDPFRLVPVGQLAEIADKFTRNEILSSNEVRAIIGYKPVDDPRADELHNANLNRSKEENPIVVDDTNDEYDEETGVDNSAKDTVFK